MGEGRWVKLEHAPTYTRWLVRFDSPQPSGQPRNDRVWVEGYRPRSSEPVPVVLVLHSWRSRRGETGRRLCRALAQRGIAAFLVVLPYHLQRTPPGAKSGDLMISSDLARTRAAFMQAVADVRATATLLQRQPWVDGQRLGLVGLSLGAIIGSLVVERDQRFRAVVLLFAGGDLGTLLWKSVILRPLRRRLQREGFTRAAIRVALREVDPLTTASAGRPRHLLMINGKYDWVMPRECVEALWRAWGKPELVWLNGGHYSALLHQGRLRKRIVNYLAAHLGIAPLEAATRPSLRFPAFKFGALWSRRGGVRPAFTWEVGHLDRRGRWAVETGLAPGRALAGLSADVLSVGDSGLADVGVGLAVSLRGHAEPYLSLNVHLF